ncbi:MAG TPA: DinB family protein [Gemmatimonadota bacterium]|nr:DinB family protein [Gemmatimonadota bacterium]
MSVFTIPASSSAEEAQAYIDAVLGLVGDRDPLEVLAATPDALRRAVDRVPPEALDVPEAEGKWSVRDVLRHLADSEIVWGWRLRVTLAQDRPPLTGWDQDLWADRLRYDEADAAEAVEEFAVLRRGHVRLLRGTPDAELDRIALHEERGEESVRRMLGLYAGHDLLHLRQIDRIREAVARR